MSRLERLLRAAILAVLFAVVSHTRADPDLFGHVRFGHDIVALRTPIVSDSFSFTTDRPWVNHEWAAETFMYLSYALGGAAGLIALKLFLLAVLFGIVLVTVAGGGASGSSRDLLVAMAVIGTFPQTGHIRPQLFSLVLFAVLLKILIESRRRPGLLWVSAPIMAVWVNFHGGWLVGAGVLMVWIATGPGVRGTRIERCSAWGAAIASVAATLVNPYGFRLWGFLAETVRVNRAEINDWQPVFRLGAAYGLLWTAVAGLAIAALATQGARRRTDLSEITVVAMLAVAAFRVNRILAFFTLSTVMLLAPQLSLMLERRRGSGASRSASRLAAATALAVALALLAGGVVASARNLSCIRMESSMFPEEDLSAVVERSGIRGRMLVWFDWGEYAIWYFSPGVKVSMDGRRETVYSSRMLDDHLRFYYLPASRPEILRQLNPDYIWLPRTLDVHDLVAEGWKPLYAGSRSVLLGKSGPGGPEASLASARAQEPLASAAAPMRCFPGP